PGVATVFIPLDPSTAGSSAVTPGPIDIRLLLDGRLIDTLTFELEAPPPLPANPRQALRDFFDQYLLLTEAGQAAVADVLEQVNVVGQDRQVLLGLHQATEDATREAVAEWKALLDGPDGARIAELFFRFAGVNGFDNFQRSLTSYVEATKALDGGEKIFSPEDVCSLAVPALCTLQLVSATIDEGARLAGIFCDFLLVAGLTAAAVPGVGLGVTLGAVSKWVATCASVEAVFEIGKLVREFVGDLSPQVLFEASTTRPAAGEAVVLMGDLRVLGLENVCAIAASGGAAAVQKKLTELVIDRLLSSKLALRAVGDVAALLSDAFFKKFRELLGEAIGLVVDATGIVDSFVGFADNFCSEWDRGLPVPFALRGVLAGPVPDEGFLRFRPDGRAEYTCPATPTPQASAVGFGVSKSICGSTQTGEATITCSGSAVTITIGDNGSLLDDIFEVTLDGTTVLTSSVPVRETSVTLDLAPGFYLVEMFGRAAPDGIGTYFIRFQGAVVLDGSPLSGTDLTPGSIPKNYFIEVQ
ncbi:MAG: hypothetical protein AAGF23_07135, partial [Acidobacteriota bacterium]